LKPATFILLLLLIPLLIPNGVQGADEPQQKTERLPSDGRIEVIRAWLSQGGRLLIISFRFDGIWNARDPRNLKEAYIIEESTRERFSVFRVGRVGALGQRNLNRQGPISVALIDNPEGKIKKDSRVTLVIGNLHQEHVVVEE